MESSVRKFVFYVSFNMPTINLRLNYGCQSGVRVPTTISEWVDCERWSSLKVITPILFLEFKSCRCPLRSSFFFWWPLFVIGCVLNNFRLSVGIICNIILRTLNDHFNIIYIYVFLIVPLDLIWRPKTIVSILPFSYANYILCQSCNIRWRV